MKSIELYLKKDDKLKRLLTYNLWVHNGSYHSDDVFCIALFYIFRSATYFKYNNDVNLSTEDKVKLSKMLSGFNSPEEQNSFFRRVHSIDQVEDRKHSIVMDILGGDYDHHMLNEDRKVCELNDTMKNYVRSNYGNITPWYASIGLLYQDLKEYLFRTEKYQEKFYNEIIFPIDMQDNHGPELCPNTISRIISKMNSCEIEFHRAVSFIINYLIVEIISMQEEERFIENLIGNQWYEHIGDKTVIILPEIGSDGNEKFKNIPREATRILLDGRTVNYTINKNPSKRNGTIEVNSTSKSFDFPKKYLKEKPNGLNFIHPQLFLATFETYEDAYNFVKEL